MITTRAPWAAPAPVAPLPPRRLPQSVHLSMARSVHFSMAIDKRTGTGRRASAQPQTASSRSPRNEGEHGVGKSRKCMGCRIFPTLRRGSELRHRGPATRRQLRLDARPAPRARTAQAPFRGFVAKAVGEGASVSLRNTFARVSDWCFGVSMPGTLKRRSQASQPVRKPPVVR